jgi:hypothetical protein
VSGSGSNRTNAETVSQHHNGLAHGGQAESVRSRANGVKATCENVGKAESTEFAGR